MGRRVKLRASRSTWETVEEQPDGSVVVSFTAPDLAWAASSVLAYGPLVTVEEPEELRDMVRQWAQAIVNQSGAEAARPVLSEG